jgi:hypothetical protein
MISAYRITRNQPVQMEWLTLASASSRLCLLFLLACGRRCSVTVAFQDALWFNQVSDRSAVMSRTASGRRIA